jgi:two-component system, OmpR family, response regulator
VFLANIPIVADDDKTGLAPAAEMFGYKFLLASSLGIAVLRPEFVRSGAQFLSTGAACHVLVVDDDRELRTLVGKYLGEHGFRVTQAANGREMMNAIEVGRFDLVVLDLMMPGESGLVLCQKLRELNGPPVIMLTAIGSEVDRVIGLEIGADDYVVKPFSPRELVARIKAVVRRAAKTAPDADDLPFAYEFNGWRLEPAGRVLRAPTGAIVDITSGEFDLLMAFVARPQRVLTRDQLLDLAKGRSSAAIDRSIDVQISRLRRKIEADPREPAIIKTIRSGGYVFTSPVQAIRQPA